jgi:hypothetical protein
MTEVTKPKKAYKWPKTLAGKADLYYTLREKRLAAEKAIALVEEEEKALKADLINSIPKSEATGVAGKLARVSVTSKKTPQVKDWVAFHAYVKKNDAFDMMGKTIKKEAIEDRLEKGVKMPFIEMFNVLSLSVGKV